MDSGISVIQIASKTAYYYVYWNLYCTKNSKVYVLTGTKEASTVHTL